MEYIDADLSEFNLDEEPGLIEKSYLTHGRDMLPIAVRASLTTSCLNEIGDCPVTLCKPYLGSDKQQRLHSNDTWGTWYVLGKKRV